MTEQEPVGDDERVARLIQAASELIDAYERKSTANQHFLSSKQRSTRWAAARERKWITTRRPHRSVGRAQGSVVLS
jgi:hypothetical protein